MQKLHQKIDRGRQLADIIYFKNESYEFERIKLGW